MMDYSVFLAVMNDHTWLKRELAEYLSGKDALSMSLVSKQSRLLECSTPTGDEWEHERSLDRYGPPNIYEAFEWSTLPVNSSTTHTVIVTGMWKDQGWGNRKGMISIVTNNGRAPNEFEGRSKDVISYIEPSPHRWEAFQLVAPIQRSCNESGDKKEVYKVWARVGGGGGHRLLVQGLTVRLLKYADER